MAFPGQPSAWAQRWACRYLLDPAANTYRTHNKKFDVTDRCFEFPSDSGKLSREYNEIDFGESSASKKERMIERTGKWEKEKGESSAYDFTM